MIKSYISFEVIILGLISMLSDISFFYRKFQDILYGSLANLPTLNSNYYDFNSNIVILDKNPLE